MALQMIDAAGGTDADYEALMAPVSLPLIERRDDCLTIGDASKGADVEVKLFEATGKPVYRAVARVPSG